jgi:hypothetical protein
MNLPVRALALRRTWSLFLGLVLVGWSMTAHAQPAQPPRDQAPAKSAPAEVERVTIVGRVTMADTGAPVRRARVWVELRGVTTGDAITDEHGRYILQGLPHERCRVVASKAPFVTMRHGQRYPNGPDTEVDLTSVSTASRVDIALWRGGVIAGRLYDDLGEPVAETQVAALRVRMNAGTRRLESTGRVVTTDDFGQYRLAGLPTGTYRAVALEFLEEGAEEDPEMLASLRERALKFDLGKGESLKLSLPLTRVK